MNFYKFIKKTYKISDKSFEELLRYIKPGVSEKDIEKEFIEDTVLVKETTCEVLTRTTKKLIEL